MGVSDPDYFTSGEDPTYNPAIDPTLAARVYVFGEAPDIARRQWAYDTNSADPLVAAVTDTTIVLLKVECWSSAADGVFTWAGSGGNTIFQAQVGTDGTFAADNLHLVVPAGEDLDLTLSGLGVGCTTWWYTIKSTFVSSPAG